MEFATVALLQYGNQKGRKPMKFDLTGKAGFPAAVAVDSHNLCSKLKSKRLR
jgi:hypothetical protein